MSAVPIHVDVRSATPIYDQIITQVKHAIAAGSVGRGEALPSVRQLAVSLRVNPNTVARAYRELESEGVVETRRGQGTFVADSARRLSPTARMKALSPAVDRLATDALRLDVGRDEVVDMLGVAWRRLTSAREGREKETKP